ncbi:MAG: hypothetical protein AAF614_28360 [Chloroflexota bacterium]
MKTSTLIGISLTLLMFVLVLLAAFLFNYQGRRIFEQMTEADMATLEKSLAESNLEAGRLQSTRTATETQILTPQAREFATVQAERISLEQQLVDASQELEQLQFAIDESIAMGTPMPIITPTQTVVQPSIIEILSPDTNQTGGANVIVIIAARDVRGIAKIELTINGQLDEEVEGEGDTFLTFKKEVIFVSAGSKVIEAKLINEEGGETSSSSVEITVELPTNNDS